MAFIDSKSKRKGFSKSKRLQILEKTNGKCAYCGTELVKFCIDHIVPLARRDGDNSYENLFAACFQCNSYKSTLSVEQFRNELSLQVERMKKRSVNARMAFKYGLIEETSLSVVFYFEELESENKQ